MSQTFMGMPIQQRWEDLGIWEYFFSNYVVRTFIELGSGHGGSTLFFSLQCYQRNIEFHTYDNNRLFNPEAGSHGLLGTKGTFQNINIFGTEGFESQSIGAIMDSCPRPLVVFFDNGNKPMEWNIYAPHTKPGDFCVVHDWETEFFPENIGSIAVDPILDDLCATRPPGKAYKAKWFVRK